jgi:hypothetical protein
MYRPISRRRRESALEARCVKWARAKGIQVGKLSECIGLPDRIFFVPGGKPLILEFKDPRGDKDDPAQRWHVEKLKAQGYSAGFIEDWGTFLLCMKMMGVE